MVLSPGVGLGCEGHGRTAGSSRPLRLCRARGEISGRLRLGDSCQRPAASRLTHSPGFWAPGEGWGCLGRCCLGSSGDASSHLPPSRWTPAPHRSPEAAAPWSWGRPGRDAGGVYGPPRGCSEAPGAWAHLPPARVPVPEGAHLKQQTRNTTEVGRRERGKEKGSPCVSNKAPPNPTSSFCSGSRNCRPALAKGQAGIRRQGPGGPGGRRLLLELRAAVGPMQHSRSFASWARAWFRGAVGSLCRYRWVGSYTGWRRGQAGCWKEGPGAFPRFQSYSSPDDGLGVPDGTADGQEPGTVIPGTVVFELSWASEFSGNSLLRKISESVGPEFLTSDPGTLFSGPGLSTPRS